MSESSQPADPADGPQLPSRRPLLQRPVTWITSAVVVVVVALAIALPLTLGGGSGGAKVVTIGVADASQPYWQTFAKLANQQLGVTLKFVNFSDYSQPNPALKEGQLDLNEFQHIEYLANYNVSAHDDLQPIGATAVYPLPLYSLKYVSASAIPADAKIAIPNDAINEARGLLVLQSAGLLTLKNGGSAFSSTADIVTHKVSVVTLDASQTAGALKTGSVAAAIVNNNYATSAGLPQKSAIFQDNPNSPSAAPYVNIFVARAADKSDPLYLKLAALYHNPAVEAGVQQANDNTAVFRTVSPGALQSELATVEAQAKTALASQ
jgi:D-methionine transport system substrate-binding protein